MQILHYSLRLQGFLMLGPSESVGLASDLFDLTDKQHRIYTRKIIPRGVAWDLVARQGAPYNAAAIAAAQTRGFARLAAWSQ